MCNAESILKDPETLLEAVRYFGDLDRCHAYMVKIKWPSGQVACPGCGGIEIGEIKSRRMFQCKAKQCRKQFSTKVGTIFEDSPLGFDKWLPAVWSIVNAKNGISSCELARAVGITQKSAWHMLHRIRLAMRTPGYRKIMGAIETDETMYGGLMKHMHRAKKQAKRSVWGPMGKNKTMIQGMKERGGDLRAMVVRNNKARTLQPNILANVEPGSVLYTDIGSWYQGLQAHYAIQQVNHLAHEYARGEIHVNSMENFWSLLKRSIRGTYAAVSPWQLQRYLDEFCRRFNLRKLTDGQRFHAVIKYVIGNRLTYKELIGEKPAAAAG